MTKPSTSRTLSILTPVRHTTAKIRIRTIPTLAQLQRPVNHGSRRFPTRRSRTELVALHQERPRHSRNGSPDMARLRGATLLQAVISTTSWSPARLQTALLMRTTPPRSCQMATPRPTSVVVKTTTLRRTSSARRQTQTKVDLLVAVPSR
jgi:hypothetical protein